MLTYENDETRHDTCSQTKNTYRTICNKDNKVTRIDFQFHPFSIHQPSTSLSYLITDMYLCNFD